MTKKYEEGEEAEQASHFIGCHFVTINFTGALQKYSTALLNHQPPAEPLKQHTVQMNIGVTPGTHYS